MGCRSSAIALHAAFLGRGQERWIRTLLGICGILLAGCVTSGSGHRHAIEFHGALVDGATGKPLSGIALVVTVDDRTVFDGVTDENGVLDFTCEVTHDHRRNLHDPKAGEDRDVTVNFNIQAGEKGGIEIPVKLGPGTRGLSLGEIRLIPSGAA